MQLFKKDFIKRQNERVKLSEPVSKVGKTFNEGPKYIDFIIPNLNISSIVLLILTLFFATSGFCQYTNKSSDFNGDGYDDLAVGIPGKESGTIKSAGAVRILYGHKDGLTTTNTKLLQRGNGIPGTPKEFELLGSTITVGNFNGDKYADLAVAAKYGSIVGDSSGLAGSLAIIYGSENGLGDQSTTIEPMVGSIAFGEALVAGDLNGDGYDELVVGVPQWGQSRGAVALYAGSSEGLNADVGRIVLRGNRGHFMGSTLAAGYFNDDEFIDIAIGAPGDVNSTDTVHGGVAVVIHGAENILDNVAPNSQEWSQNSSGILERSERYDLFGASFAAGNFDGQGSVDLAIGVPGESLETNSSAVLNAGGVHVLFGFNGLAHFNDRFLTQTTPSIPDNIENGDKFASSLTAGDFNGDGKDDLVVGVPNEDYANISNTGIFHIFYGIDFQNGIGAQQLWSQDSRGLGYGIEKLDFFAESFGTGDFNDDGFQDLAVSSPNENIGQANGAGAVIVIYGSSGGLSRKHQYWAEHVIGLSRVRDGHNFGKSLSNAIPMKKISPIDWRIDHGVKLNRPEFEH